MKRWEYMAVEAHQAGDDCGWPVDLLNTHGAAGWEMLACIYYQPVNHTRYFFRRELPPDAAG